MTAPNAPSVALGTESRWQFVQAVTLPTRDDEDDAWYAPPRRVLNVRVVAERAYLSIDDYEETNNQVTMTQVLEVVISAEALLNALGAQMGVEWVQGLLRPVERSRAGS